MYIFIRIDIINFFNLSFILLNSLAHVRSIHIMISDKRLYLYLCSPAEKEVFRTIHMLHQSPFSFLSMQYHQLQL